MRNYEKLTIIVRPRIFACSASEIPGDVVVELPVEAPVVGVGLAVDRTSFGDADE